MGERIIPSPNSLVKYSTPEIVSVKEDKPSGSKSSGSSLFVSTTSKTPLPAISKETEDALNCILPPREWDEDGVRWRQKVSTEPVTRTDVIKLGEQLDLRLQERQARVIGVCPVRRELFTQCFDELVRQITLNCVEQGILLLRVRDEMRMTIRTYQALYESSIAFGLRKIIQAEQGKCEKDELIEKLETDKKQLEEKIEQLEEKARQVDRRNTEIRLAEQKKYEDEMQFLRRTNQQLKLQLEGIINPKK
ncbi:axonemal dynein light intermediate polypeptide 1 [Planococcus citri]|uniref:axonemal dynein light intermediate polypeptide 1 n=1 Tax=Planococcus citri TaxID=170843 RepID=UPI0031F94290